MQALKFEVKDIFPFILPHRCVFSKLKTRPSTSKKDYALLKYLQVVLIMKLGSPSLSFKYLIVKM